MGTTEAEDTEIISYVSELSFRIKERGVGDNARLSDSIFHFDSWDLKESRTQAILRNVRSYASHTTL